MTLAASPPLETSGRTAAEYRDAARGFAAGTPDGMAGWLVLCCRALRTGAQEALSIAEALAE